MHSKTFKLSAANNRFANKDGTVTVINDGINMTLQEKLHAKLQPHADRIKEGKNDEFDYLPAVLFHLIEEHKQQSNTTCELVNHATGDMKKGLDEISSLTSSTHTEVLEKIVNSSQLAAKDIQSVIKLINQIKDEAKIDADTAQAELKTIIASEIQKTRRRLFAVLIFGLVTLGITILLYAR
jgi:hypothetical protein